MTSLARPDDTAIPAAANWHAREARDVVDALDSRRAGLEQPEAESRLARYGANTLPEPPRRSAAMRLLLQFKNVLIYVLMAAAFVTALLGHWVDAGVIIGVVLINAVIGYLQEGKAERALDAIRSMLSQHAQVLRDGQRKELPAESLVPGDIVFVASGDKVPADLRLLEVRSLRIDEAILTGESMAVEKQATPVAADSEPGDRFSIAYSGTLVAYGQGIGVVTPPATPPKSAASAPCWRRCRT